MILVVTQNGTLYNISDFKFITIENVVDNDEPKFGIVVNQTYIIGYYNTEKQAIKAVTWIASRIGECFNPNTAIIIPTPEDIDNLFAFEEEQKMNVGDKKDDNTTDVQQIQIEI